MQELAKHSKGKLAFYFSLQFRRSNRVIRETGFHPVLGYVLLAILFAILSALFFLKVSYAEFIYPFLALGLIQMTSESQRNQFLKILYSRADYRRLRWIENLVLAVPFAIFLLFKSAWLPAAALFFAASLMSLWNSRGNVSLVIPSPFSKWPFEFTIGFRNTFWIFILGYLLTGISIYVDNFNLGVFSIVVAFLTLISFYSKPESTYYVWIHSKTPADFLKHKIRVAVIYGLCITLPMAIPLMLFYPNLFYIVLLVEVIGMLFLITSLVGKYAYYPSEINLVLGLTLGACILIPPALLIAIPLFYRKATNNLNSILH